MDRDRPLPQLPGVEHRYVDAADLRVHVAEAGSGEPLVLQHGWPQNWLAWSKLIPPLAENYRVICPDLRGHGWSEAPPAGYDKEQLASDLLALLDALKLERARVVGHDWGGFAGFLAALRAPERIERLAALGIVTPWLRASRSPLAFARTAYQPLIAAPRLGRRLIPRIIPLVLKRGSGGTNPWSDEAKASYLEQFRDPARAEGSSQVYRTFLRRELGPILKGRYARQRLTVPTLLLYGANDPVITEQRLGRWRDHADDMRVEQIPGAWHFLPEEAPDPVLARLVPFLR